MGVLTEYTKVREITSGSIQNLAYILNNNDDFSLIEYKVLQSQNDTGFIKCMQTMYNGKIQLYYLTSGYRKLTSILPSLDGERFMTVIANLLRAIIEVKNNGFLSYSRIDVSFDRIFINPNNLSVGLIYIPINVHDTKDLLSFETELRTNLVRLIDSLPALRSANINQFYYELSNGSVTLEGLLSNMIGMKTKSIGAGASFGIPASPFLTLEALNAPMPFKLIINKDQFVIGKSTTGVDGVITFNSAISRMHCRITRNNGNYLLEDLGSTNGTYLNKVRLVPSQPVLIKNGDIIQLANSRFQVRL